MVSHISHIDVVVGRYALADAAVSCFYAGKLADSLSNRCICMVFHLSKLMGSYEMESQRQMSSIMLRYNLDVGCVIVSARSALTLQGKVWDHFCYLCERVDDNDMLPSAQTDDHNPHYLKMKTKLIMR